MNLNHWGDGVWADGTWEQSAWENAGGFLYRPRLFGSKNFQSRLFLNGFVAASTVSMSPIVGISAGVVGGYIVKGTVSRFIF